ncbi:hypothetical protein CTEN210_13021 [Chaetoceros tenuissimus]|uniref:N-acetyltransferase domain-containing protein n=1 Tax=Chaetoceros tenuissimus TaxID=426638 RepID=A0AAD3D4T0_9STRA|nr:hypothetical protein CTEN210_13021 [Chaetoceros tenuissimus]
MANDNQDICISDQILQQADENYFESWEVIVSASSKSDIHRDEKEDDMLLVCAGLSVPLFNVAFVTRPLIDPQGAVDRAIQYFTEKNIPGLICVREGVDPMVDKVANNRGLTLAPPHPGMILHPISSAAVPPQLPAFEIVKVKTESDLDDFSGIADVAFGMPDGFSRQITTMSTLQQPGVTYFLGKLNGKPIATSALIVTGTIAGIYWVTVDSKYRRRGIGTQMCWAAAEAGQQKGCCTANLQASKFGRSVYEKIGFRIALPYNNYQVDIETKLTKS